MPQSNVIFFYLFAAFIVFITLRGELPKYMGFLLASPRGSSDVERNTLPDITPHYDTPTGTPDYSKISSIAKTAAMFLG